MNKVENPACPGTSSARIERSMERVLTGLRPFTPSDYGRLAELIADAQAWPPAAPPTVEEIRQRWMRWHVQPESDVNLLPGAAGELIAYSRATLLTDSNVRLSFDLAVRPTNRCLGIGSALYKLVEERARNLKAPYMTTSIYIPAGESRPECRAFLEKRGFYADSAYWQLRLDNIRDHCREEWPEGFTVRSIENPKRDAERWAEMVRINFREQASGARVLAQMNEPGSSPEGYFFAVDSSSGTEIGTSRGRIDFIAGRPVGYVATVSVLDEYQGRGVARALIARTLNYLHNRGADSATLFVESHNERARHLYDRLGWKAVYQTVHYWKSVELEWQNLDLNRITESPTPSVENMEETSQL